MSDYGETMKRRAMKFISVSIVTLCMLGVVFGVMLMANDHTTIAGSVEPGVVKEVVVRQGDTLWTIAERHGPEKGDIRRTVDRIRTINDLNGAMLFPGMTLKVPTV